ncbi:related to mismatched base pair and cruciform DNA recognition protein [Cephalotrichum gorgonifer]|uniref:Related to mismatched base pair and cruciform DNA recognition protein n=1 Tax=Cephalotrichum gorgonifer TaxID=2041049 RepID=A0AAE8MUC2_9PEZI|nr:related to mismatched base pair and cruciform DNA recognition protein [Cephalotrichum gorgonifer]
MSDNNNTSTLNSYITSAAGAVQSGIASITGNTGDKANAEHTKSEAEAQKAASQSAAKLGPFSIGSEGGVAKDSSDRTQGQYDQTMGSLKEATGNLLGNDGLVRSGREQNASGQGQEAKGQLSDLGQGISDRVGGAVGGALDTLTGDREGQQKNMERHDEGKARQRGVELELNKDNKN